MKATPLFLLVKHVALVAFVALMPSLSVADSPPEAPGKQKVFSANKVFFVLSDPKTQATVGFKKTALAKPLELWRMQGYFPVISISDDGRHCVAVYAGGNLLNLDHRADETMLSFYDRGQLIHHVRLDEIVKEPDQLRRTASHYLWANSFGFVTPHRFHVGMPDGKTLVFDATSGRSLPPKSRQSSQ